MKRWQNCSADSQRMRYPSCSAQCSREWISELSDPLTCVQLASTASNPNHSVNVATIFDSCGLLHFPTILYLLLLAVSSQTCDQLISQGFTRLILYGIRRRICGLWAECKDIRFAHDFIQSRHNSQSLRWYFVINWVTNNHRTHPIKRASHTDIVRALEPILTTNRGPVRTIIVRRRNGFAELLRSQKSKYYAFLCWM